MNGDYDIQIFRDDDVVRFAVYGDNLSYRKEFFMRPDAQDLLRIWLTVQASKSIFRFIPFNQSRLQVNKEIETKNARDLNLFCAILDNTNNCAIDAVSGKVFPKTLQNSRERDRNILFYNVSDDLRYRSFYEVLQNKLGHVHYRDLDLGFDRENRVWKDKATVEPPLDFLKFLIQNSIGTIVTVNKYLFDAYLNGHGVHLGTLLALFKIRVVTIRNDPPDMAVTGYLREGVHDRLDSREHVRFSNLHCLASYWQKICNKGEITYVAIPQDYSRKPSFKLRDDYRVIVLSNSRWESAVEAKAYTTPLLDALKNPYTDLTTWYLSMRKLNLESDTRLFMKQAINSKLHQFFFVAAQELKFRIVQNLIPKLEGRELDVYGDVGWKNVCPEHYRGSLSNQEINKLFELGNFVVLLLNCSYTYLDASGPVYDMIRRGVPWINIPPVVKTEALAGLEGIEYTDSESLASLVRNAGLAFTREPVQSALENYRALLQSSVDQIVAQIGGEKSESLFEKSLAEHESLLSEKLEVFIQEYDGVLRMCLKNWFSKGAY